MNSAPSAATAWPTASAGGQVACPDPGAQRGHPAEVQQRAAEQGGSPQALLIQHTLTEQRERHELLRRDHVHEQEGVPVEYGIPSRPTHSRVDVDQQERRVHPSARQHRDQLQRLAPRHEAPEHPLHGLQRREGVEEHPEVQRRLQVQQSQRSEKGQKVESTE